MIGDHRIEGHAIVSGDDRIAGRDGNTPPELSNEADWLRFQRALDEAAVVVLGRLSHEANPNVRRRNRLIVSSSSPGIERRGDGWWWNPKALPLVDALAGAAPNGGVVAVPGGRLIFDLFRSFGFDAFHLARCEKVLLPGGVPLFSAVGAGVTAAAVLAGDGLVAGPRETLDPKAEVSLVVWRRPAAMAA
jgi:hypothetical protein